MPPKTRNGGGGTSKSQKASSFPLPEQPSFPPFLQPQSPLSESIPDLRFALLPPPGPTAVPPVRQEAPQVPRQRRSGGKLGAAYAEGIVQSASSSRPTTTRPRHDDRRGIPLSLGDRSRRDPQQNASVSDLRRQGGTPARTTSRHTHHHSRDDGLSSHQTRGARDDGPLLKELDDRNRALQEKDEVIRRLEERLEVNERKSRGSPTRRQQTHPGNRDLRHVLNSRRRHRREGEGSSDSHPPGGLGGSRPVPESPRLDDQTGLKELLDRYVKQEVQARLAEIGFARDQTGEYEEDDQGMSPFSQEIKDFSLPERFSVPRFVLYDEASDPAAHLRHFTQRMLV